MCTAFSTEGRKSFFTVIDEAYSLARQSGPRVKATREGRRVTYDVNMGRRVGFVGGESGARRGHPAANHVRLVLEGENVITAFPFRP